MEFQIVESLNNMIPEKGVPIERIDVLMPCKMEETSRGITEILPTNIMNSTNFECHICLNRLSSSSNLRRHMQNVHKIADPGKTSDTGQTDLKHSEVPNQPIKIAPQKSSHMCNICSKFLSSSSCLQRHILTVHKGSASQEENSNSRQSLELSELSIESAVEKPKYPCPICSKSLSSPYQVKRHISVVHAKNNVENTDVQQQLDNSLSLQSSQNVCETNGEGKGVSSFISALLSSPDQMENRLPTIEEPKNDENINIQEVSVSQSANSSQATAKLPSYPCPICSKLLSSSYGLKKHMSRVHAKENVEKKDCIEAQETYLQSSQSDCQSTVQKDLSSFISALLSSPDHVEQDMLDVENAKPYENNSQEVLLEPTFTPAPPIEEGKHPCSLCSKSFSSSYSLRRHSKTHAKENVGKNNNNNINQELLSHDFQQPFLQSSQNLCETNAEQTDISSFLTALLSSPDQVDPNILALENATNQNLKIEEVNLVQSASPSQPSTQKPNHSCPICSRSLSSQRAVKRHVENVHGKDKSGADGLIYNQQMSVQSSHNSFQPNIESKDLSPLISTLNSGEQQTFTMNVTTHALSDENNLQGVKPTINLSDTAKKHSCHICSKSYLYPYLLKRHIARHHKSNQGVIDSNDVQISTQSTTETNGEQKDLSSFISEFFSSPENENIMVVDSLNNDENITTEEVNLMQPPAPVTTPVAERQSYPCPVCSKHLSSSYGLRKHMRNVHSKDNAGKVNNNVQQPYTSQNASEINTEQKDLSSFITEFFSSPDILEQNIMETPNDNSVVTIPEVNLMQTPAPATYQSQPVPERITYQCPICSKWLSSSRGLKKHVANVHEKNNTGKSDTVDTIQVTYTQPLEEVFEPVVEQSDFSTLISASFSTSGCVNVENHASAPEIMEIDLVESSRNEKSINVREMSTTQSTPSQVETGKKVAECPICHRYLSSAGKLRRHVSNVHYKNNPQTEKTTNIGSMQSGNFDVSGQSDAKLKISCHSCNKLFSSQHSLKRHMFRVHLKNKTRKEDLNGVLSQSTMEGDKGKYSCHVCSECFDSVSNMSKHFSKVHINSDSNNGSPKVSPEKTNQPATTVKFACPVCEKLLSSPDKVKRHILSLHPKEESWKKDLILKRVPVEIVPVIKGPKNGKTPCHICFKVLASPYHVKRHISRVHKDSPKQENKDGIIQTAIDNSDIAAQGSSTTRGELNTTNVNYQMEDKVKDSSVKFVVKPEDCANGGQEVIQGPHTTSNCSIFEHKGEHFNGLGHSMANCVTFEHPNSNRNVFTHPLENGIIFNNAIANVDVPVNSFPNCDLNSPSENSGIFQHSIENNPAVFENPNGNSGILVCSDKNSDIVHHRLENPNAFHHVVNSDAFDPQIENCPIFYHPHYFDRHNRPNSNIFDQPIGTSTVDHSTQKSFAFDRPMEESKSFVPTENHYALNQVAENSDVFNYASEFDKTMEHLNGFSFPTINSTAIHPSSDSKLQSNLAPKSDPNVHIISPESKKSSPESTSPHEIQDKKERQRKQCSICFKYFSNQFNLNRHMKSKFVHRESSPKKNKSSPVRPLRNKSAKLFSVDSSPTRLLRPLRNRSTVRRLSYEYSPVRPLRNKSNVQKPSYPKPWSECKACGYKTQSPTNFDRHRETWKHKETIRNRLIEKRRLIWKLRKRRQRLSKLPVQRKCIYCSRRFKQVKNYTIHRDFYHKNVKPFKCNLCTRGYLLEHLLDLHLVSEHTYLKATQCCKSFFIDNDRLKKHLTNVHGVTRFRDIEIDGTGDKTVFITHLYKPNIRYSPAFMIYKVKPRMLICPYCKIQCTGVVALMRHLKIHSRIASKS